MPAPTVVANTAAGLSGQTLALLGEAAGVLAVRTTDPAAPTELTAWLWVSGTTSGSAIQLRMVVGGAFLSLPLGTIP